MKNMIDKAEAMEMLREKQLVYGVCSVSDKEKKRSFFKTGIPDLDLMQPNAKYVEGKGYWFEITKIEKHLFISPADSSGFVFTQDLCLGYVASSNESRVTVQVLPKFFLPVINAAEVWGDALPEVGTPCAVVVVDADTKQGKAARAVVEVETFTTNVFWPKSIRNNFNCPGDRLIGLAKMGAMDPSEVNLMRIRDEIANSYEQAVRENAVIVERRRDKTLHYSFEFRAFRAKTHENAPIFIGIRADEKKDNSWYVEFAGLKAKGLKLILERDVEVPDLRNSLKELADMALPEDWTYAPVNDDPYYVLDSYFHYTYYNAWIRGLVFEDKSGKMKLFDTGLVSYNYEPIYCVFEKNFSGKKPWKLSGFCVSGQGALGKKVTSMIANEDLPPRVEYIKNLSDLFMDTRKPVNVDTEHILMDNVERLPASMLLGAAGRFAPKVERIVNKISSRNFHVHRTGINEMKKFMEENRITYMKRLGRELDDAVYTAIQRARWNYKTAVPVYYAARNCISLLLPLCLSESDGNGEQHADVALVISKQPSGNYQAETIYTLDMAYLDSRLICRPDSDWLAPSQIMEVSCDPMEEDF